MIKTAVVYDPKIHHRRLIRAKDYDYARDGVYFIAICAQDMKGVFGEIEKGEMKLSGAGRRRENAGKKFQTIVCCPRIIIQNQKQIRTENHRPHCWIILGCVLC